MPPRKREYRFCCGYRNEPFTYQDHLDYSANSTARQRLNLSMNLTAPFQQHVLPTYIVHAPFTAAVQQGSLIGPHLYDLNMNEMALLGFESMFPDQLAPRSLAGVLVAATLAGLAISSRFFRRSHWLVYLSEGRKGLEFLLMNLMYVYNVFYWLLVAQTYYESCAPKEIVDFCFQLLVAVFVPSVVFILVLIPVMHLAGDGRKATSFISSTKSLLHDHALAWNFAWAVGSSPLGMMYGRLLKAERDAPPPVAPGQGMGAAAEGDANAREARPSIGGAGPRPMRASDPRRMTAPDAMIPQMAGASMIGVYPSYTIPANLMVSSGLYSPGGPSRQFVRSPSLNRPTSTKEVSATPTGVVSSRAPLKGAASWKNQQSSPVGVIANLSTMSEGTEEGDGPKGISPPGSPTGAAEPLPGTPSGPSSSIPGGRQPSLVRKQSSLRVLVPSHLQAQLASSTSGPIPEAAAEPVHIRPPLSRGPSGRDRVPESVIVQPFPVMVDRNVPSFVSRKRAILNANPDFVQGLITPYSVLLNYAGTFMYECIAVHTILTASLDHPPSYLRTLGAVLFVSFATFGANAMPGSSLTCILLSLQMLRAPRPCALYGVLLTLDFILERMKAVLNCIVDISLYRLMGALCRKMGVNPKTGRRANLTEGGIWVEYDEEDEVDEVVVDREKKPAPMKKTDSKRGLFGTAKRAEGTPLDAPGAVAPAAPGSTYVDERPKA